MIQINALVDNSGQLLMTSLIIFIHYFDCFLICLFVTCVIDESW